MEITIKRLEPNNLSSIAYLLTPSQKSSITGGATLGISALVDGGGVGVLLFCLNSTTITASLLMVAPSHSRLGVGSALLSALRRLASQQSKKLVFPFVATGQSSECYRFFVHQPKTSVRKQSGFCATISRQSVQTHIKMHNTASLQEALPLLSQSPTLLRSFSKDLSGTFPTIAQTLYFTPQHYSAALSFCTLRATAISSACILEEGSDFATLSLLFSQVGCGAMAVKSLLASMGAFLENPDLQRLHMVISTDASEKILNKICPDYVQTHYIYHAYF